ncbi:phosphotransferase enzyme family protein [Streptomyces sp. NPDC054863]
MPADQDTMTADQERHTVVGDARWVGETLHRYWGPAWSGCTPLPLNGPDGAPPLSHTAGLWRISHRGAPHLFKVQLTTEAQRGSAFPPVKQRVLDHCAAYGIPVASAVPTAHGTVHVSRGGHDCEVLPLLPGTATARPTPAQAAAAVRTGLALRAALDAVPAPLAADLAPIPLPALVAEEDWRAALDEARTRLLPAAHRRTDHWGRAAERALTALLAAEPLLARYDEALAPPPERRAVVHGDLHHHHFLLGDEGPRPPRVSGVLDFDNLHVGDRLLDLAWLAELAGRADEGPSGGGASVAALRTEASRSGLLVDHQLPLLMPVLIARSVPIVVDIAKDILERDLLGPAWLGYFELLDTGRRLRVHRLLTG